jgi:hypothetical protein
MLLLQLMQLLLLQWQPVRCGMNPDVLTMAAVAASSPRAPHAAAAQHARTHGQHSSTSENKGGEHWATKLANNSLSNLPAVAATS